MLKTNKKRLGLEDRPTLDFETEINKKVKKLSMIDEVLNLVLRPNVVSDE